jgi:TolA-binding protein
MTCDERLREMALALPVEEPSELALRRLRARILSDVATGAGAVNGARWPRLALAGALFLAGASAGAWWLMAHRTSSPELARSAAATAAPPPPEPMAGSVVVLAAARWTQVREGPVEHVDLTDGEIRVHVRPQRAGERFLVELPDGAIEVRGTTFDVAVVEGVTAHVHVDEGTVELRLTGRTPVKLGVGETWAAAPLATVEPSAGPPPAATVASKPLAARATTPPEAPAADDGAAAYGDAVRVLREGRAEDAAAAFHALLIAHPRSAQAEDASYLEAVALARAGRTDAAALAAEHHLASFPSSFHRKEAATLVARTAAQQGNCAKARSVMAPWTSGPASAETRTTLGACAE